MVIGNGAAYVRAGPPVFTTMRGPPMYHTTGEVLHMVSVPGLERMARFTAARVIGEGRSPERARIGR